MNVYLPELVNDGRSDEIHPIHSMPAGASERRVTRRLRRAEDRGAGNSASIADHFVARAALATLEKLNRGVLLLDPDGTVRFMNRAAWSILHRRHGLTLHTNRLVFSQPAHSASFNRLLEGGEGSLVLRVDGPMNEHGAYRVLVSPLDPGHCVFIYEPDPRQQPPPERVLRELYGLTLAEARLASAVFVAGSLSDATRLLGVSLNTAKTTLKRVFAKCEVTTQAELLRLLSLGPRTL